MDLLFKKLWITFAIFGVEKLSTGHAQVVHRPCTGVYELRSRADANFPNYPDIHWAYYYYES